MVIYCIVCSFGSTAKGNFSQRMFLIHIVITTFKNESIRDENGCIVSINKDIFSQTLFEKCFALPVMITHCCGLWDAGGSNKRLETFSNGL